MNQQWEKRLDNGHKSTGRFLENKSMGLGNKLESANISPTIDSNGKEEREGVISSTWCKFSVEIFTGSLPLGNISTMYSPGGDSFSCFLS